MFFGNFNKTLKPLSLDYILSKGRHHILYKDNDVLISIPLDYYASKWLAYNTCWCTFTENGYSLWSKTHHLLRVVFTNGKRFKCNISKKDKLNHDYSIWYDSIHYGNSKGLIGEWLNREDFRYTEEKEIKQLFNSLPEFAVSKIHEFQLRSNFV